MKDNCYIETGVRVPRIKILKDKLKNLIRGFKNVIDIKGIVVGTLHILIILTMAVFLFTVVIVYTIYSVLKPRYYKQGICPYCGKEVLFYNQSKSLIEEYYGTSCENCKNIFRFDETDRRIFLSDIDLEPENSEKSDSEEDKKK